MPSLVWILWPASVIFTAVLSYRIGAYWGPDDPPGRHRAGAMPSDDPWDDEQVEEEPPPRPLPPRPVRWWSDEDDTEVLPRIEE